MSKLSNKILLQVFAFIPVFFALFWLALPVIQIGFVPTHDYAVDILYTNSIGLTQPLLVGHYSRFGFHHPGPFWFYLNKFVEISFEWLAIPRYNVWMIGSVFVNSVFIIFSGRALSFFLFNELKIWVTYLLLGCLLLLAGGDFLSTWMPNRLVTVYIAFLVCLLNLANRNDMYLVWCAFFGCALIHGYITMLVFVLLPLFLVLGIRYMNPRMTPGLIKIQLWFTVIIIFLFSIPMVIDALYSNGGNLFKIITAQQGLAAQPKPSWPEVFAFFKKLIFEQPFSKIFYTISASLFALMYIFLNNKDKQKFIGIIALTILISMLIVLYYKTTPAPLYPYIARFYIAVPIVLAAVIWSVSINLMLSTISNKWYQGLISAIAGCLIFAGTMWHSNRHTYPVFSEVRWGSAIQLFAETIANSRADKSLVVINYTDYNQWGFIAGLMVDLTQRNIRVCTTWTQMSVLYTARMLCTNSNVTPDYLIVADDACKNKCEASRAGFGLIKLNDN